MHRICWVCVDTEPWSVEYKLNATGPWWCWCEGSQAGGVLMFLQAIYRSSVCSFCMKKQLPDLFNLKKTNLIVSKAH